MNKYKQKRIANMAKARAIAQHGPTDWEAVLITAGNRCVGCGDHGPGKDHVVPVSAGGSDGPENLQPLCFSCNCKKGTASVDYRPHWWGLMHRNVRRAMASLAIIRWYRLAMPAYMNPEESAVDLARDLALAAGAGPSGIKGVRRVQGEARRIIRAAIRSMRKTADAMEGA